MLLFAVAHALQLKDGSYAIRSPEFSGCEARNARVEVAREQFGETLRERLLEMIEAGEVPPLYTYEELTANFTNRCTVQMPAEDRMPGTFDRVMAVRAKLSPDAAERLKTLPVVSRREQPPRRAMPPPNAEAQSAPPDTSATERDNRAKLGPSARLALVAARLAGRDRHLG
jgi:hypothetical protein